QPKPPVLFQTSGLPGRLGSTTTFREARSGLTNASMRAVTSRFSAWQPRSFPEGKSNLRNFDEHPMATVPLPFFSFSVKL
ncbi:MAG: hypothetical protein JXA33_29920, partial [Anaerolineae bacterium]|nr:hypothetical protein [Anaerolineae bacterium]